MAVDFKLKAIDKNGDETTEFEERNGGGWFQVEASEVGTYTIVLDINGQEQTIEIEDDTSSFVGSGVGGDNYYVDKGSISAIIDDILDENGVSIKDSVTYTKIAVSADIIDHINTTRVTLTTNDITEDQSKIVYKIGLKRVAKVDTYVTVKVDSIEHEVLIASGKQSATLEITNGLPDEDTYVEDSSKAASIVKIRQGNQSLEYKAGVPFEIEGTEQDEFERLRVTKREAEAKINDTETPVHVNLTATPSTSEDTGSITYTATLSEADLSDDEVIKHKGVTVTLDEKDADGNDIVITIADGERSGTVDIAVNRDDIYKETEDTISNKIKSVANVLEDDAVGAFESLVANTDLVTTAIEDDPDAIKVTLIQVKADGSTFGAGESRDIKEGQSAFYKVDAAHDGNNVNIPIPIVGTVDVQFTNGSAVFDDYLVNGVTLGADGKLSAVAFGSTIEVQAPEDNNYEGEAGETFSVALVADSAVPMDAPAGTSGFELVHYEGSATTTIKENQRPVDVKLVPTDKGGNILKDGSKVVESQQAHYKAILVEHGTNIEIVDTTAGKVTVSIADGTALVTEDYMDKVFVDGAEVADRKVDIGTVFTVKTVDNLFDEQAEKYQVSINTPELAPKYKVEVATSTVETTITDDEDPIMINLEQVKNEAGDAFVAGESTVVKEGEKAFYKVKATKDSGNDVDDAIKGSVDVKFTGLSIGDYDASELTKNVAFGSVISTTIVDDYLAEASESFDVSLVEDSAKPTDSTKSFEKVNLADPVTTVIEDNETPVTLKLIPVDPDGNPTVDADGNPVSMVEESKQAHYVAELYSNGTKIKGATGTVDIVLEDVTALDSEDYDGTIQTVTIGTPFTVDTVDNYFQEADETFKVSVDAETFSEKSTYEGVVGSTVVTTIKDDIDPLNITLEATPSTSEDGGSIVYTAKVNTEGTLTPVHHDGIEVKLDNGETIMIAQDAMSGTKTVVVNRDDVYKEEDSISNHIVSVQEAGRGLESLTFDDAVQKSIITDDEDAVTATLTADTVGTTTTLNVALSQAMMHDVKNPLSFTIADNGTAMKDAAGNDVVITINTGETMGSLTVDDMSIGAHDITFLALPTQDNMGDFEAITPVIDKSTKLDIIPPCPLDPEDDCTFIRQGDTKKIDVLGNDSGKDLKILSVDGVEHGSVSITQDGRCLTYTSDDTMISGERLNTDSGVIESYRENPFFGTDSFTYTVQDKYGQIGSATVDAHIISTGDKRDVFNGDARDEYVVAGGGNDYLAGGAGNDWYFFSKGDDKDVIVDTAGTDDRIVFTSNVGNDATQLKFKLESDGDLLVCYGENGDMITVKQQQQTGAIDRIEMDNGCYLSNDDVDKIVQTLSAYNAEGADGAHMISEIQNDAKFGQIVWHNRD